MLNSKITCAVCQTPFRNKRRAQICCSIKCGARYRYDNRMSYGDPIRTAARVAGDTTYMNNIPCSNGHTAPRYTRSANCVVCSREAIKERAIRKKDDYADRRAARRAKDPAGHLFRVAQRRARVTGQAFTITASDIIVGEKCQCCGIKYDFSPAGGRKRNTAASLDRFDSTKGYVPGNVNVICWKCNWVKSNSTLESLETVIRWMRSKTS